MRTTGLPALALLTFAVQPMLAQTTYNQTVVRTMSVGKYTAPLCPLKGGDFRTTGAGTYLKTAIAGSEGGGRPDEQRRLGIIGNALKTATEAAEANPQSAAAWYYIGRANLYLGDLVGADSAFTRLVALSPDCAGEVGGFRQTAWRALVMPTSQLLQQQKFDSALVLLREAAIISRDYPQGFFNAGVAFYNLKQYDSAIVAFKMAQKVAGSHAELAKEKSNATFNLAALLQSVGRNEEAATEYRAYLAGGGLDAASTNNAKQQLAAVLRLSGKTAEASVIEKELLATSGTAGGADLSSYDLMRMGNGLFGEKKYTEAADAYMKLLAKEPGSRDALFNLANTYYAAGDGAKLVTSAQQLLQVDPMNEDDYKLLGQGYKLQNDQDNMLKAMEKLFVLPMNVTVTSFSTTKTGAKLVGTATGREAEDPTGKVLPPAPVTIVWEFLDANGTVVATQETAIGALQPSAKKEFTVEASGAGIVVWRYHRK